MTTEFLCNHFGVMRAKIIRHADNETYDILYNSSTFKFNVHDERFNNQVSNVLAALVPRYGTLDIVLPNGHVIKNVETEYVVYLITTYDNSL